MTHLNYSEHIQKKNLNKASPMADSSSSRPPLCERISHKSYFLRAVDLTILGLLFSLLLYRIQRVNENETVWVVALLCESCFLFIWLLITCIKWEIFTFRDTFCVSNFTQRHIVLQHTFFC